MPDRLARQVLPLGARVRKQSGVLLALTALPLFLMAALITADPLDTTGVLVALAPALFYAGYAVSAVKGIERGMARRQARFEARVLRRSDEFAPRDVQLSRHYFEARLEQEIKRSQRHVLPLCVVTLSTSAEPDKAVFTSQLLELTARTLRAEDSAGRLGRNLYAICLPHTTPAGAAVVIERLGKALVDGRVEFGIAYLRPGRGATPRLLIDLALETPPETAAA